MLTQFLVFSTLYQTFQSSVAQYEAEIVIIQYFFFLNLLSSIIFINFKYVKTVVSSPEQIFSLLQQW